RAPGPHPVHGPRVRQVRDRRPGHGRDRRRHDAGMDRSLPPGGSPRTSDDVPRSLPRVVATAVLGLVVVASALAGPWVAEGRGPGVAADRDLGAPRPPPPDKLDDRELAELVERLPTPDVDLGGLWTVVLVVVTV